MNSADLNLWHFYCSAYRFVCHSVFSVWSIGVKNRFSNLPGDM